MGCWLDSSAGLPPWTSVSAVWPSITLLQSSPSTALKGTTDSFRQAVLPFAGQGELPLHQTSCRGSSAWTAVLATHVMCTDIARSCAWTLLY